MLHMTTPSNTRLPACITGCIVIIIASLLGSCTSIMTGMVISPAMGNLQKQQDVDLVCEGAPAYLLMIDSLIESDPTDNELLFLGTQSYSGSTAALTSCNTAPKRIKAISFKAKYYGKRLLSSLLPLENTNSREFNDALAALTISDTSYLFWGAFGWLTWIRQEHGSPASMADLIVVEKLMARVLELDETMENGSPHLFFGALYGAKPAIIGGDLKRSRNHFEQALIISDRSFLLIQTTYAATYSRMAFNKELHNSLLQEVLDFPLEQAPENVLSNQIAKRKARALLEEDFFAE